MNGMVLLVAALASAAQDDRITVEHFGQAGGANEALVTPKKADLRFCVGGLLAGAAAWTTSGKLYRSLLEGLDAVAVGYQDLAAPAVFSLEGVPLVCANVIHKETGRRPGATHVIRTRGGKRIAIVGITRPPRHLNPAKVWEKWTFEDPRKALKKLLPALASKADVVFLLAVMDRIECARLIKDFPRIQVAFVPAFGTNDPEPLPLGDQLLVQSPVGRSVLGRLRREEGEWKNEFAPAALTERDRRRVRDLYHKYGVKTDASVFLSGKIPRDPSSNVPTELVAGKTYSSFAAASNRAARIELRSISTRPEYGGKKAPAGGHWLLLETEWENRIPMQYVFRNRAPVKYRLPDPGRHGYVVADGRTLLRLDEGLSSGAGGLFEGGFDLPRVGSRKRGNLVFPLPDGSRTLEFRFYDYAHGHARIPILDGKTAGGKPVGGLERNEAIEAGLYAPRRVREFSGKKAAEGRVFYVVDFRARSLHTQEADATAFDPRARRGEKIRAGAVADWRGAKHEIELLADGKTVAPTGMGTLLRRDPRFLPDILTGGTVVFEIPETAKTIELVCRFGNAKPLRFSPEK